MDDKLKFLVFISLGFTFSYSYADLKVYYIPLAVETYVPVTPESIEEQAHYIFTTKDQKMIKLFDDVLVHKRGFSQKSDISNLINVRAKLIDSNKNEIIYFDNMSKAYVESRIVNNSSSSVLLNAIGDVVNSSCNKKTRTKFSKKKCK